MARHDVSSPARATPASLFPNDFSSKNTVEKRVQADAIEAAKRKKADEEAAELARLRTAYPRLEAQTKALESERAPKDIELAVLRRQVGEMEHQLVQFRQDYDIMRTRLKQRDLDPSYAGKRIQIRLACWPHSAIELRDNPDGRAYGGECDPSARSQALRLKRVNVIDPNSAWTISLYDGSLDDGNFHLGLHSTSAPEVESQLGRNLDGPYKGNLQEWIFSINSQMTGYTCVPYFLT